ARRGDVESAALARVVESDRLLTGDRRGAALGKRAVVREGRVDQLAQVGQLRQRGEFAAVGGRLEPFALQQLRRGRAADVVVEGGAAVYVNRAARLDQLDREAFLGDLALAALAGEQFHVERDRFAPARDRAGDVDRGGLRGGGFGGRQDLGGSLRFDAVAGRGGRAAASG